jgi:2',3'-cyclic-nucleotide 2'-phosphodiesterase (5'-nucleotidase family)
MSDNSYIKAFGKSAIVFLALICLFCVNPAFAKEYSLTVLHTNDIHGRLQSFDYSPDQKSVGGIARRATLIKEIKSTAHNVLTLDAGDTVQGSLFFKFFGGVPDIGLMSKMGYDVGTVGNHEFDKGIRGLEDLVNAANYPYVSANLRFTKDKYLDCKIKDYVIKDYNGLKIAVIGLIVNDVKTLTSCPQDIKVYNDIKTVKKIVKKLDKKVDYIIVLSHVGVDEDVKIAKAVPQVDLIVGGHSHTLQKKPIVISHGKDLTLIVQSGELGMNLGRLDLAIDNKRTVAYMYKLIPVTSKVKEDESVAKEVDSLAQKLEDIKKEEVGILKTPLNVKPDSAESPLTIAGRLFTESVKNKYPDLDAVMLNRGGIRANKLIDAGPITKGDICELCPFDNTLVVAEVSGKKIKSILETSARSLPNADGSFLQTLGIDYTIDTSKTSQKLNPESTKIVAHGNRISNININGMPLDEKKLYKVGLNSFMFDGGDGYTEFKGTKHTNTGILMETAILDYLKSNSPLELIVKDKVVVK